MPHETSLITMLVAAFVLAFALGFLAAKLRVQPLVGYLLAGVLIGPFTPGFVADAGIATQLAEIGVILLMFGVGLHFSIADLLSVRHIALPGAVAQIATATAIGAVLAVFGWGWGWSGGIVFGLALSVASTVVLLRALEERDLLNSPEGRIAVGWLIVEDLAMVLALVLLPAFADSAESTPAALATTLGLTVGKVVLFVALILIVGKRVVPWLLMQVARVRSREMFTLAVLGTALGIAYGSAALFGVSFALGAFFAGVVLNESDLAHQAGADSLPLKDAFAVLFFVSVGMLFDPSIVVREPGAVIAVFLIIVVGKSLAAFGITLLFRYPLKTALTVSASLAQIGEFSFILAGLGIVLGLMPELGRDLILAGALLSITFNPIAFACIRPLVRMLDSRFGASSRRKERPLAEPPPPPLHEHTIISGYGRVGGAIGPALRAAGLPYIVIEQNRQIIDQERAEGRPTIFGDAGAPGVLEAAGVAHAKLLIVATPDAVQARRVVELARDANPDIDVLMRTHTEEEREYLESHGVGRAMMGERELAFSMMDYALRKYGVDDDQIRTLVDLQRAAPPRTYTRPAVATGK